MNLGKNGRGTGLELSHLAIRRLRQQVRTTSFEGLLRQPGMPEWLRRTHSELMSMDLMAGGFTYTLLLGMSLIYSPSAEEFFRRDSGENLAVGLIAGPAATRGYSAITQLLGRATTSRNT